LQIYREIKDRKGESNSLNNLGLAYKSLGQYQKAIDYHTQSLTIKREIGDRKGESNSLNNLGLAYKSLGQYQKAIDYYTQSLTIDRDLGDRNGESKSLNNLGSAYHFLGQYQKAIDYYTQSLTINREIGDREGEGITLNNIALLLAKQNQPELAIVFYKQSVNVREAIRRDIKGLPKEQQQSYTDTVAGTYRNLADLLLKQDRILEAQRVLDLLKVQELEDYLRNVRGSDNSAQGIPNIAPEQPVVQGLNDILSQAIQLGQELAQLEKIPPAQRTTTQQQRIVELRKNQQQQTTEFVAFFNSPEVKTLVAQLRQTTGAQNINLEDARSLQDNLRKLPTKVVILYPFVLEDRLELILVTADAPPIRRTVAVKRLQLNQAIANFRTALQNPNSDATTPARQLYDWLIKPIENDLTQAQAKTIIYAPDAQLRYIPLASLYDGKQWLVERFAVNNITALSLTELNTQPARQLQVFAGAFTSGSYSFKVGEQQFNFRGLPFAATEVNNLAATIPNTTKVLNGQFKPDTVYSMNDYSVVHLATHAAFVVGKPEDSFILFGDGGRVTLRDVETWNLPKVDLVVLSACETGLGGKLGNGEEILGLGYQIQRTGARAAIASLWSVDDGGTQALMNAFYGVLKQGNVTKAEALRLAQVSLIVNNNNTSQEGRGSIAIVPHDGATPRASDRLSHPYYWAPFILIGNGL
jgi:CHAT domain-containing protein/Tfp pilus assembly protein PilF